ncbi:hypothetical protein D3C77_418160 [compost metagenome]
MLYCAGCSLTTCSRQSRFSAHGLISLQTALRAVMHGSGLAMKMSRSDNKLYLPHAQPLSVNAGTILQPRKPDIIILYRVHLCVKNLLPSRVQAVGACFVNAKPQQPRTIEPQESMQRDVVPFGALDVNQPGPVFTRGKHNMHPKCTAQGSSQAGHK